MRQLTFLPVLLTLIVLLVMPPVKAQAQSAELVLKEDTKDFGSLTEGDKRRHAFTFLNAGDAPLIITDIPSVCSCTVPQFPKTPIMPGQTGQIIVEYNSTGKSGLQRRTLSIKSNSASPASINIQAYVKARTP